MLHTSKAVTGPPIRFLTEDSRGCADTAEVSILVARLLAAANGLDARIASLEAVPALPTSFNGVCLISAGRDAADSIGALLSSCGLAVWSPYSDGASYEETKYECALCLVLNMPDQAGLETLELFRRYGIWTPAILIVDNKDEMPADRLLQTGTLAVIPRPVETREFLRWIECICATQLSLRGQWAFRAGMHHKISSDEGRPRNAVGVPCPPALTTT